jgi:diguanylate cyclase (GGDEF)-like protein
MGGARRTRLSVAWAGALVALLLAVPLAATALVGQPPVTQLKPNAETTPQNLDLVQDDSSLLYVANGRGVLTFDGEAWQLIGLPNGDLVSSLAYDGTSRVYVGAHNLIGYLERDGTGLPIYHDLTPLIKDQMHGDEFGDVTATVVAGSGVFFVSTNFAFRYDPVAASATVWRHPGRFGAIALLDGVPILQFRGEGLRQFRGKDWVALPGSGGLEELSFDLAALPDGGLLSMSSDGHWREYRDGTVREHRMPSGFPQASVFNLMRRQRNGSITLGATTGELWMYDPASNHAEHIRITEGPINGLLQARDGGLFALSDLAVFHIDWPGEWTIIGQHGGINGNIHGIKRWNDRWYALSNNGVNQSDDASAASFHTLDWTDNDAWDLLVVDRQTALLAELYRLKTIDRHGAHIFGDHDLYPRVLVRSRFAQDLVYVGTEYGVAVLRKSAAGWELILDRGAREMRVDNLVELAPNEILAGTARSGVQHIEFSADHTHIVSQSRLGSAAGIEYGQIARAIVSELPGTGIVASTKAGLFHWDGGRFANLQLKGLEDEGKEFTVFTFRSDPGGRDWAFGENALYRHVGGDSWKPAEIGNFVNGYIESIAFDGPDVAMIGCASAILRHENPSTPFEVPTPVVLMRSIDENGASTAGATRYPLSPAQSPHLPTDFNVSFHFALPDFHGARETQYQARLKGRDEEFTQWQTATTYQYRHLPPGLYTFEAFARDRQGRISQTGAYSFTVEPPWYLTNLARVAWIALGVFGIIALVTAGIAWRTKRFAAKRTELEGLVAERTQDLVNANTRLQDLAHRDVLTGLANRALFEVRLEQARASAVRHHRRFAVLFVDLDQFKTVNDSMGHEAGDRLLRELADRLSAKLRREDTLARWGGDEFMVLAEDLPSIEDVAVIAQTLVDVGSTPFSLADGHVIALSTSVGVSVYPDDSSTPAELIRNADTAMYSAKGRGGNQVCFYASEMTDQARTRLTIANGLRLAIERDEFRLHYQPIVDIASGQIVGAEALLRWQRDADELMLPAHFIPIAESSDLILAIGAWVLRAACRVGYAWAMADDQFDLAVNVSPRQLRNASLVQVVREALEQSGMPPAQLTLEITESTIAEVGDEAQQVIDELKALGVHIAVDDFGTGLSALSSLKKLRVDCLKIDRSFVRDIPHDSGDSEIAATIVAMGHNLRLIVTAEGVETEEQLDYLRACGCDRYQGLLFSAPVPSDQLSALLDSAVSAVRV